MSRQVNNGSTWKRTDDDATDEAGKDKDDDSRSAPTADGNIAFPVSTANELDLSTASKGASPTQMSDVTDLKSGVDSTYSAPSDEGGDVFENCSAVASNKTGASESWTSTEFNTTSSGKTDGSGSGSDDKTATFDKSDGSASWTYTSPTAVDSNKTGGSTSWTYTSPSAVDSNKTGGYTSWTYTSPSAVDSNKTGGSALWIPGESNTTSSSKTDGTGSGSDDKATTFDKSDGSASWTYTSPSAVDSNKTGGSVLWIPGESNTTSSDNTSGSGSRSNENASASDKTAASAAGENLAAAYKIKWIDFKGAMYAVVTQNENGPCPLLAIANVLLLRGQIELPSNTKSVSEHDLLQLIVDCILRLKPKDLSEADQLNYEKNLSDVLSLVPSLPFGLDVNIYFTGVQDFEFTTTSLLFDLLSIPLVHGWIADPQQTELVSLLNGVGYNQVAERVVASEGNDVNTAILADFLQSSATQLTFAGLRELRANLKDGDICVLFRNNHFHTLHKHKDVLFLLLTDQGFINEVSVVWETLNDIDGSCVFVDALFRPSKVVNDTSEISDYLLALSLQEEEEENHTERQSDRKRERVAGAGSSAPVKTESETRRPTAPPPPPVNIPSKRSDKSCSIM